MTHPRARAYEFDFSQMNLYGFTDSLATIAPQPNECTNGHIASRVSDGLCLGCLLQAGLTEDEDCGSESLDALLSEIEILGHQPASQELGDPRGGDCAEWV